MRWVLPSFFVACAGACHHAESAPPTVPPAEVGGDLARYAPLTDGTVLAYATSAEQSSERGIIVWRVSRPRPNRVELDDGGHVERLDVEPDGLRHTTGGYWLKAPLTANACWPGRAGEVCVTSLNREVSVPAGRFTGCLETEERRGTETSGARTTTVFCPDVGMVLLEVEAWAAGEVALERAELTSYGPAVDLAVPPAAEPPPDAGEGAD